MVTIPTVETDGSGNLLGFDVCVIRWKGKVWVYDDDKEEWNRDMSCFYGVLCLMYKKGKD